jgi:hypothetical protein
MTSAKKPRGIFRLLDPPVKQADEQAAAADPRWSVLAHNHGTFHL